MHPSTAKSRLEYHPRRPCCELERINRLGGIHLKMFATVLAFGFFRSFYKNTHWRRPSIKNRLRQ
jgi:hypothetical protein